MARRHQPVVSQDEYLEYVTGETELAKQDEQLQRQEEHQPRTPGRVHSGDRPAHVDTHTGHGTDDAVAVYGVDDHQLPAGIAHPGYSPVTREKLHPKVPGPYFGGSMAGGVPGNEDANHGSVRQSPHARHGHHVDSVRYEAPEKEPDPVPVYIVERAAGGKGRLDTATDVRTAPASGSDPIRLTSQDLRRRRVGLLNEDSSHDARVSKSLADLAMGKGILLPGGSSDYLWLCTQDDLFAVANSSTAVPISVITEYELPGGG